MKTNGIRKNITVLLLFLFSGISAGVAATEYSFKILPFTAQALPAPPIGIVVFPFIALWLSCSLTAILALILFVTQKNVNLSLLWFHKGERKSCFLVRIIGFLIIIRLIYTGICEWIETKQFFISGLWYYTSVTIFILCGLAALLSIFAKELFFTAKPHPISEKYTKIAFFS